MFKAIILTLNELIWKWSVIWFILIVGRAQ